MITIDEESRRRVLHPLNFDNLSERYVTENGLYSFTSPSFWAIEKNLYYLMYNSKKKLFEQKYKYKPDYLSFDEYETVVLSPLLMTVNNIFSCEDFDMDYVIIPSLSAIIEMTNDKFPIKEKSELTTVLW